jgi:hypothetical protein
MKSNGYRLIRHESKEAFGGAVSYRSFRKMSQGVLGNGEVKDGESVAKAKASDRR